MRLVILGEIDRHYHMRADHLLHCTSNSRASSRAFREPVLGAAAMRLLQCTLEGTYIAKYNTANDMRESLMPTHV